MDFPDTLERFAVPEDPEESDVPGTLERFAVPEDPEEPDVIRHNGRCYKFDAKIQQKNEICKFLDTKYEEKGKKLHFFLRISKKK